MNLSFFYDWVEERLFGEGELANLAADIIDEAMAHDTPGEFDPAERVEEALLASAWRAAQAEDEAVQARAAVLLGRLGYRDVQQALSQAEESDDTPVASAATVVLGQLHGVDDEMLQKLVAIVENPTAGRELRSAAARAVASKNTTESTLELVRIADDDDADLAQYGLEGLGCSRPEPQSPEHKSVLKALLAGLETKDPLQQGVAAEALGAYGDASAIKPLESLLIEKNPAIRRRALFALAMLGAESAKPPLTRMVRDFSIPARWEIVDLIGRCYGESMVDVIALAAEDRDEEIRDHVVAALGKMDGDASIRLLQKIAESDKDKFVREQAEIVLTRRGEQGEPVEPAPEPERPEPKPSAPPPPKTGTEPPPTPAEDKTGGAPKPPEPVIDPRSVIEIALNSMECSWSSGPEGYEIEAPVEGGKQRVAILLSKTDRENSPVCRFVVNCDCVRPASFEKALRSNHDLDYGSIAVTDVDGVPTFVVTDTMPARAASAESVRKTVTSLAHSAAAFQR